MYAVSSAQLTEWREGWGLPPGPLRPLAVTDLVPDAVVEGPVAAFTEEVRGLHARFLGRS